MRVCTSLFTLVLISYIIKLQSLLHSRTHLFIADSRTVVVTLTCIKCIHEYLKSHCSHFSNTLRSQHAVTCFIKTLPEDNKNCLTLTCDFKRVYVSSCQNSSVIGLCSGGGVGGRPILAALCFAFQQQQRTFCTS